MMYVALKRLKIGTGFREIGEPVPEAAEWPTHIVRSYMRSDYLKEVHDPAPVAPASPVVESEPEADATPPESIDSNPAPTGKPKGQSNAKSPE